MGIAQHRACDDGERAQRATGQALDTQDMPPPRLCPTTSVPESGLLGTARHMPGQSVRWARMAWTSHAHVHVACRMHACRVSHACACMVPLDVCQSSEVVACHNIGVWMHMVCACDVHVDTSYQSMHAVRHTHTASMQLTSLICMCLNTGLMLSQWRGRIR